ncbi:TPR_1 domain-containing protein/TPR_11 domain-containing protein, partial [Cephalotus follicularis]
MKLTWNKKSNKKRPLAAISQRPNLPFDHQGENTQRHITHKEQKIEEERHGNSKNEEQPNIQTSQHHQLDPQPIQLAHSFQAQGNKLAQEGKFSEALGKWEAALNLMPENAVLHEQKAQILLEIGDTWNALKAVTRATELEPSWAEAWITLGRAQLNFGEPDCAIESFDKALEIKPDCGEAQDDRRTALHLVKRRKQLHSSGLSTTNRYMVSEKTE